MKLFGSAILAAAAIGLIVYCAISWPTKSEPSRSIHDVDWSTVAYCMEGRDDPYDTMAQKAAKLEYCVVFEGMGQ